MGIIRHYLLWILRGTDVSEDVTITALLFHQQVNSFTSFDKCTNPCNHHPNRGLEHFCHPSSFLCASLQLPPPPQNTNILTPALATTDPFCFESLKLHCQPEGIDSSIQLITAVGYLVKRVGSGGRLSCLHNHCLATDLLESQFPNPPDGHNNYTYFTGILWWINNSWYLLAQ